MPLMKYGYKRYKTFNGKRYELGYVGFKSGAEEYATSTRRKYPSGRARVIKSGKTWLVYRRPLG